MEAGGCAELHNDTKRPLNKSPKTQWNIVVDRFTKFFLNLGCLTCAVILDG